MKQKMAKLSAILLIVVVLGGLPAKADPIIIDGVYDALEDYDTDNYVTLDVEDYGTAPDKGHLWTYQPTATSAFYGALIMPRTLVDNSYGDNIVNWSKAHKYDELKKSDDAVITIKSGSTDLFSFKIDYLEEGPFRAVVKEVTDFALTGVEASDITASTSQVYNMLTYYPDSGGAVDLKKHSPLTLNPSSYDIDPSQSNLDGWEFDYIYEFCIDSSVMSQFGDVSIGLMHISPNKLGGNKVWVTDIEPVPVPPAVILGVIGLGFSGWLGRRKFSV